jgi:RND family efflux transporter MFP subunit
MTTQNENTGYRTARRALRGRVWRLVWHVAEPTMVVVGIALLVGVTVLWKLGAPPRESVSIEKIQASVGAPVEVVRPRRRRFAQYIVTDGSVTADVQAMLRAKIDEVVESVNVRVGESVEPGQTLVTFRDTDIQASIAAARAAADQAQVNYQRIRTLVEQGVLSEDRLEQALTARENAVAALRAAESRLQFTKVTSPVTGHVAERWVEPGEFKSMGKELLTIVDLATVEVRALVQQEDIVALRRGMEAEFQLEGDDRWRPAKIDRMAPSTTDPNRYFDVFMAVENPKRDGEFLLRPGMYADVRFVRFRTDELLSLPEGAIARDGDVKTVLVIDEFVERLPQAAEVPPTDAVSRNPDGPGDVSFVLALLKLAGRQAARVRQGAAAVAQMVKGREPQEVRMVEQRVLRGRRVTVTTGPTYDGEIAVESNGDALSTQTRVVFNPREDLLTGTRLHIVGEAH